MSAREVLDSIDGALRDYETSADAMRWTPDPENAEPVRIELGQLVNLEALSDFGRKMCAAMYRMAQVVSESLLPLVKLTELMLHAADAVERPRWHKNRCRTCNPAGNPPPWPGGHEYHRRMKARARRARRR